MGPLYALMNDLALASAFVDCALDIATALGKV